MHAAQCTTGCRLSAPRSRRGSCGTSRPLGRPRRSATGPSTSSSRSTRSRPAARPGWGSRRWRGCCPRDIAAPFTSLLADRGSRRDLLLRATLVRALALALAAAAVAAEAPFAVVLIAATVQTVAESAVKPAQSALLPDLARTPEQLGAANAVLNGVENVGFLIGALAGGLVAAGRESRPALRRPPSHCCSPPSRCAACRATRPRRTARRGRVPGWRPRCWRASRWCCGSGAFGSWSAHWRWRPWSRARPTS